MFEAVENDRLHVITALGNAGPKGLTVKEVRTRLEAGGDGAATEPPRGERPVMHDSMAPHVDATLHAAGLPPSHASVQEGWLEGTALHAQPTGCRGVHQPFPIGPGVRGVASRGFHVVGGQCGRRKQFLPAGCPGREPSAPLPLHTGAQSGAGRVPVSARDHNPLACSSSLRPACPACFREEREKKENTYPKAVIASHSIPLRPPAWFRVYSVGAAGQRGSSPDCRVVLTS
jgi:hypothetical protein